MIGSRNFCLGNKVPISRQKVETSEIVQRLETAKKKVPSSLDSRIISEETFDVYNQSSGIARTYKPDPRSNISLVKRVEVGIDNGHLGTLKKTYSNGAQTRVDDNLARTNRKITTTLTYPDGSSRTKIYTPKQKVETGKNLNVTSEAV